MGEAAVIPAVLSAAGGAAKMFGTPAAGGTPAPQGPSPFDPTAPKPPPNPVPNPQRAGAQALFGMPPMPSPDPERVQAAMGLNAPEGQRLFGTPPMPSPDPERVSAGMGLNAPETDRLFGGSATPVDDNYSLAKKAGYTTETIPAEDVTGQPAPTRAGTTNNSADAGGTVLFGSGPDLDSKKANIDEDRLPDAGGATKTATKTPSVTGDLQPDFDTATRKAQADAGDDSDPGLFGAGMSMRDRAGVLQDRLGDLSTNPLGQVSLALLSSGYDGSNPWKQINAGLSAIPGHNIAMQGAQLAENADKRAEKKLSEDEQDKQLQALIAQLLSKQPAAQPGSNLARGAAKAIR